MSINIHSKPPDEKYIHKPTIHVDGEHQSPKTELIEKISKKKKKKKGRK